MAYFTPIIIELAIGGILFALFWLIVWRVIDRERASRKSPFTKELLKGPGESCLRKIDELNDQFNEWYMMLFVGFGIFLGIALGLFLPGIRSPVTIAGFVILGLGVADPSHNANLVFPSLRRLNALEVFIKFVGFLRHLHSGKNLIGVRAHNNEPVFIYLRRVANQCRVVPCRFERQVVQAG